MGKNLIAAHLSIKAESLDSERTGHAITLLMLCLLPKYEGIITKLPDAMQIPKQPKPSILHHCDMGLANKE